MLPTSLRTAKDQRRKLRKLEMDFVCHAPTRGQDGIEAMPATRMVAVHNATPDAEEEVAIARSCHVAW